MKRRKRKPRYPVSWPKIAQRVKDAAGWRCEHCGHPHDIESHHVLTVHHLDGDPANCEPFNLVALCQRCHLHVQAKWKPGEPLPAEWRSVPDWIIKRDLPYLVQAELWSET